MSISQMICIFCLGMVTRSILHILLPPATKQPEQTTICFPVITKNNKEYPL